MPENMEYFSKRILQIRLPFETHGEVKLGLGLEPGHGKALYSQGMGGSLALNGGDPRVIPLGRISSEKTHPAKMREGGISRCHPPQ